MTIQVFQPTLYHAKVILVDREPAIVGSANFNQRSRRQDDEVCLVCRDPDLIATLQEDWEADFARCAPIELRRRRRRGVGQRLKERAARAVRPAGRRCEGELPACHRACGAAGGAHDGAMMEPSSPTDPVVAPPLAGVLETALYVDDMARAREFYEGVLGLRPMFVDQRLAAYDVGGRGALLVFQRGASMHATRLPGGMIPPHDGSGPVHYALAIAREDLPAWEARLAAKGVAIEGRTDWPRGGHSIYFRDPDGHLGELATPGIWPIY